MNPNMLIQPNDKIFVTVGRNDDGTNNGSISIERRKGHVYCIAKAPRYASDEEWKYNADLIVKALSSDSSDDKN